MALLENIPWTKTPTNKLITRHVYAWFQAVTSPNLLRMGTLRMIYCERYNTNPAMDIMLQRWLMGREYA